ncbi:hypothetical protein BXO88_05935 [Oribacterium sp. C9]|uniref:Fur family transcriptional regulator n=1 Tax=Oribacterium sp. C9 TaxID=1943579 RepID=UPI0009D09346|nr:transcriptional repressor [Oribacterium sp. C9]OON86800.1 hypothetical protein BXO88_05935 [Oribacterium sp. C9]
MKAEYKTKARTALLDFLQKNSDKSFSAVELLAHLQQNVGGINVTTVYRNLDRLCDQGVIFKFREPDHDAWFYQYSAEHEHCDSHMHGQCSECGRVFHLENDFVEAFEKLVKSSYGLDVDPGKTVIVGKCEKCKKK